MAYSKAVLPVILILQIGIIYLGYSFSSKHVVNNNLLYSYPPSTIPAEGNMVLFWGIIIAAVIAFLISTILLYVSSKKRIGGGGFTFKKLFFVNNIPLGAILIATYMTYDQLIAILIYTFFFVLIVYFRDY